MHDTIFASTAIIVLESFKSDVSKEQYEKNDSSIWITAILKVFDIEKKISYAYPKYHLINNHVNPVSDSIPALGLRFIFWKINPDEKNPDNTTVEIMLSERKNNQKDFIVMEAYMFPFINILWLGCLVMVLGTGLAVRQRIKANFKM